MLDKYYTKVLANTSIYKDEVYISKVFNKEWFKMPKICLDVLDYSYDNDLKVGQIIDLFEEEEDKAYFRKILKNLDSMRLLFKEPMKDICMPSMNKVTFAITNKCNLNCSFCSQDSKITDEVELSFNQVKDAVDKIMMFKPMTIVLTGGEPMIRADFFDIVNYINSKYDVDIQLCTNGTFINEVNVKWFINKIQAVDFSLDGYDEVSCSNVRGKGTFEKVVKSIDLIKQAGINKISASMVLGNHNREIVDKFTEFCDSKSIKSIKRGFMRIGRGDLDRKYLKNIMDSACYPEVEEVDDTIKYARTCGAGIRQLYVDHRGDVFPCSLLDSETYKICSVEDIDKYLVNKIYKKEIEAQRVLEELSPLNNYRCTNCKYKLFCNNCLANMKIMIEDEETFKHNCEKLKHIYKNCLFK